jgi:hypothetical protein
VRGSGSESSPHRGIEEGRGLLSLRVVLRHDPATIAGESSSHRNDGRTDYISQLGCSTDFKVAAFPFGGLMQVSGCLAYQNTNTPYCGKIQV